MEKLSIEEIKDLFYFVEKTKNIPSKEYSILSRLHTNYQEMLQENHNLASLDTKLISQMFQEHQIQQDRIADERNKVIKNAALLIRKALYFFTLILVFSFMVLAASSCTTRLQQQPPPPDCGHIEHDGGPASCNLFGNDNCYFEWAYEHGVPVGEDEDCDPYSEKRKGRCYPI